MASTTANALAGTGIYRIQRGMFTGTLTSGATTSIPISTVNVNKSELSVHGMSVTSSAGGSAAIQSGDLRADLTATAIVVTAGASRTGAPPTVNVSWEIKEFY